MPHLPIDQVLPRLLEVLQGHSSVVLQAAPGAGKTTRVPLALLNSPILAGSRIVMLEPRRLAATNAARWMAACLGEEVGGTVGYAIRFERKVSSATRIEVVTEGVLSRRLHADPGLAGVGVVIFDEFHERSLHADLALALCRDVQLNLREELKILVMSATLECGPVAEMLGGVPIITSEGRIFPVDIRYLQQEVVGDIAPAVVTAIVTAAKATTGDILVFLPGAGEIRRCQSLLKDRSDLGSFLVCPLYGDLPFAEQERAIKLADRRKVVLATNVAETSLTIEGVQTVIDSGWCRRLRFDPATGLNRLVTERVSVASATQRTGRAGRLCPGLCYRMWGEHVQRGLIPFQSPEISSAELSSLVLDLALWGIVDAATLSWLDNPPAAAFAEARRLLENLGAVDAGGRITSEGKIMADLPVHPRLARMLLEAQERGYGALGSDLAALLSERDIFRGNYNVAATYVSPSDLLDRVERLDKWRLGGDRTRLGSEVDAMACRTVDRIARQIRAILHDRNAQLPATSEIVGELLAVAYPDRIARQREPGSSRYLLANGRGGRLTNRSAVSGQQFIVAVNVDGGDTAEGRINLASAVSLDALRRMFVSSISRLRSVMWDPKEGRVVAREEERLEALVLSTRAVTPMADEVRRALLQGVAGGPGLTALDWNPSALQLAERVRFLARWFPGKWPDFSPEHLEKTLGDWLGPFIDGIRSLPELARVDIVLPLRTLLSWEQQRSLEIGAPTHIQAPSGSRVRIDYGPDEGPVMAVKLQELFGLAETPTVAWGKVPLLLHLLSPAGRPIQVTRDLRNFWNVVYPEVKKELKGRYAKHPWPDDPWMAVPTKHTKRRGTV